MIRPRGPRTAQHLATRERPGEVTLVLWFTGFLALNSVASCGLALFLLSEIPGETAIVWSIHVPLLAAFVAAFIGLRRRTGWGFWLSCAIWGSATLGLALGCLLSLLNPEEKSFFGSLTGAVTFGVFSLFSLAPFLLLAKARRRYFGAS